MSREAICKILSRRAFLAAVAGGVPAHYFQHQAGPVRHRYERRVFPAMDQPAIGGVRHEVWTAHPQSGAGPDVIVLHEITGATDLFFAYTDTLVDAGFSVHCPVLFGSAFGRSWFWRTGVAFVKACHPWAEFECEKESAFASINPWLVALATDISGARCHRVGAIGMCLTGIQPLAMLRCRGVVAPVLCQPTLPFGRNETDLGLPPSDVDFALARVLDPMAKEPLEVLQIRYSGDRIASPRRADRLKEMFGSRMTLISLPGDDHSSLVHDPHETARKAVIDFLRAKLTRSQPPCVV